MDQETVRSMFESLESREMDPLGEEKSIEERISLNPQTILQE